MKLKTLARTAVGVLPLLSVACSTTEPNRNPVGEAFPVVQGESLKKQVVELPAAVSGEPAILMVGYVQQTQFDLDRWAMGLTQAGSTTRILEVPAIPATFPSTFLRSTIDNGMRAGIPSEDWGSVVTLYGKDADQVAKFTGTQNARNGRIILLDDRGTVRWFWDQGYSVKRAMELLETAEGLQKKK